LEKRSVAEARMAQALKGTEDYLSNQMPIIHPMEGSW